MNISSVIVQTTPQHVEQLVGLIKAGEDCEYHLHDDKGRIIVTLEAEGADSEVVILKRIQALPNVLSADLVYAYSEDELEQERSQMEQAQPMPDWLNDENASLKDIQYKGDLKGGL